LEKEMPRNSALIFAFWLLSLSMIAGCSHEKGPMNNFHPYGINHAALHLEYFGETRGTDDLFFDNFGKREAHIMHSEVITDKGFRPTFTYSARNFATVTAVDSIKLTAVRLIDKTYDSLFHLSPGDVPTPEQQFASFFGSQGFVRRGDTVIRAQGVTLDAHVWQQSEQPSYLYEYRGLVVGNYANIGGHVNELRLVSIDTVNAIDTMRFAPPNGFPLRDLTKQGSNLPNGQP
jgi:hypothetical protein